MRNADSKRSTSRPAAVIAAALLLAIPAATAFAQTQTQTAAASKPAATDKAKEAAPAPSPSSAAPAPSSAAPAPATGPVAEPAPIVIVRTEVYGQVVSRFLKNATVLSLVATSSEPVKEGSKALLFRKIEEPGKPPTYVEIAEVTIKKHKAGGKIDLTIVSEKTDVLVNGKKANHFTKNTKIKLQVDRPG